MTAVLDAPVCRPTRIRALAPVSGADIAVPVAGSAPLRYANLDYAASAPALTAVADQTAAALTEYASVHRGAGYLSQVTTARYEQARETVRAFVGGRADDTVVFTRNTTDSINLAASVTPGDVVVLDIEHHANLLPWARTGRARVVSSKATVDETIFALDAELAAAPAALLAVTAASNVTGEVLPIARLAGLAHRHGARILVDGAQLVPHRAVSIASFGIDYLVFSGHKLYAPFGAGVLVGRSDWLDAAEPYLAGGGASAAVGIDEIDWHTGAARHEAGSPNVLGVISIAAAAEALCDIGFERIGQHEEALVRRLDEGIDALGHVRPLRIFDDAYGRVGIAGFVVDGYSPRQVAEHLSTRHGIGVRDGKFCAHPLLAKLGHPDGAVRASFGVGTGSDDVDRLLDALAELAPTSR
ncbi:aminotransferase class V-fold PLP-dependent enzyme [Gordonia sp. HY002]|uniref:aminotransferase class V-fold PLP-dependent enzyme n=1 Tax=Gordonia zhenghanii TaxID=2911516 RepID=UPI001EF0C97B|nr:aminotransferase class V-fold PLP-dependent enzyme [Gordonia zhenghanii]MCF8571108.1 aminotransferase class V-fold PLP-dependent enzyme [Gordonia zhenghanii]MCF8604684.1 aminotransferase class V-fold PLP-dependent enzyme [Gordonia zhenghanii]